MKNVKSWLPSVMAIVLAGIGAESTQIQAYIGAHANLDAILGALAVIIAHLMPSPIQTK